MVSGEFRRRANRPRSAIVELEEGWRGMKRSSGGVSRWRAKLGRRDTLTKSRASRGNSVSSLAPVKGAMGMWLSRFFQLVGLVVHHQHAVEVTAGPRDFARFSQQVFLARPGVMPPCAALAAPDTGQREVCRENSACDEVHPVFRGRGPGGQRT